jgi:hypothetical protein
MTVSKYVRPASLRLAAVVLLLIAGIAGIVLTQGFRASPAPIKQKQSALQIPDDAAQGDYASGDMMVAVYADRPYGYRIGYTIPVTMIFVTKPAVELNIVDLTLGILDRQQSVFETVTLPTVQYLTENGLKVTQVTLLVRTFDPQPHLELTADFLYATERTKYGSWDWQPASTPPLPISTSNTVGTGNDQIELGDMSSQSGPRPLAATPLSVVSYVLLLVPLTWLILAIRRRLFPRLTPDPAAQLWRDLDGLVKAGSHAGLSQLGTLEFVGILRRYLKVESLPSGSDELRGALERFFEGDPKRYEHARVARETLAELDRAIYQKHEQSSDGLSREQFLTVLAQLERFVARSK